MASHNFSGTPYTSIKLCEGVCKCHYSQGVYSPGGTHGGGRGHSRKSPLHLGNRGRSWVGSDCTPFEGWVRVAWRNARKHTYKGIEREVIKNTCCDSTKIPDVLAGEAQGRR